MYLDISKPNMPEHIPLVEHGLGRAKMYANT